MPVKGSFYRSQHEFVGVFRVGQAPHLNNVELGRHGRSRSNVWHYAGVNSFRAGRMEELRSHPSAKPVALVADAIKDCTRRGDVVLDTFSGSGTTIMAADRVARRRSINSSRGKVAILKAHGGNQGQSHPISRRCSNVHSVQR